jgi:adenosylmethionine-8-amino-7-oxononanoate aminotransferase
MGALPNNAAIAARDLAVVWHPCTQMHDHERLPLVPIERGEGVWLYDFEGRRYLDGISSWWVNLFGHANPRITAALAAQAARLEHVLLAGFTHEPALQLAEALTALAPAGLVRCFFADNGSAAVEVAVKMSFHYWQNLGRPGKRRFVTLSNSYHGETLGALAVGDVELYKKVYQPLLMDVITVPSPDCHGRAPGESWEAHSRRMFAPMEATLAERAGEIAAVIVEPLVQCAGSMRMYHPVYLKLLREACDRHDVLLIADEIAVGFGRTGTLFGYLPLSVVLTTDSVYQAFYDEYVKLTAFLHSHSYTGNPLACAVALETMRIFRDDDVIARNKALARRMADALAPLAEHPQVAEVRQTGMIAAVEFVKDRATGERHDWRERRGLRAYQYALGRGALLRPIGNVVYLMPPYVITPDEIDWLAGVAAGAVDAACA